MDVRDQIALSDVEELRRRGYRTIIDLRPDGEAPGQVTANEVGQAARALGLGFAYIPTPHGDIPDEIVEQLAMALATSQTPVILYCRSGNRAARVWALAEASRPGGLQPQNIIAMVTMAGQKIDDLTSRIHARVAARKQI